MLYASPKNTFETVQDYQKVEIIDTDDGVMEEAYFGDIKESGLKIENMKTTSSAAVIGSLRGVHHYECEEYLFIFEPTKVYAIIGNDKYFEISVVRNYLSVNSELQGYATTLGIPCRYSINSPFFVTVYYNGDFERVVYLQEKDAIYKKGIRSQLLRRLLY